MIIIIKNPQDLSLIIFHFEDIKISLNEQKCTAKFNKYYGYIVIFGKTVEMLHLNCSEFNLFITLSYFNTSINLWIIAVICSRRKIKFTKVGNFHDFACDLYLGQHVTFNILF